MIVVAAVLALAIAEGGRRDPARWGAPGTAASLASALALLATTIAAAFASRTEPLGVVLVALGIALRVFAMRALGDAFTSETVFVPGRPVVTRGLYRWTRHPSDLGLVLYAGGIVMLGASAIGFGFFVALVVTTIVRVTAEEKKRPRSGGG